MQDDAHLFKPFTPTELRHQNIVEAIRDDDDVRLIKIWEKNKSILFMNASISSHDSYILAASHFGSAKCIDYLASQGADVHQQENTCLYRALKSGRNDAVDVLLNHGADIHARNNGPARYAAVHDDKELAEIIFVRHNLKVNPEIQTILNNHDCPGVKTVIRSRDLHDKLSRNVSTKKDIPKQEPQTTRSGSRKI